MLQYKLFKSGDKIRLNVEKPYEMLSALSHCSPSKIDQAIKHLQKVVDEKLDFYSFEVNENCIIDVAEVESLITYDNEENSITVETQELLKLLKDIQNTLKSTN
jgi:uncharacterized tellurite resistance protein B-like protein